jgi:hypothetical protein
MDVSVLLEPKIDLPRLAEILDGLGHEGRVHTIRTWTKKRQAALFEAAKGHKPIDLDFVVPPSTGNFVEVIHWGQNTLPAFSHFQKRFTKADSGEVVGYNEGSTAPLVGPGYYTATKGEGEHAGEVVIDYTTLPKVKAPSWPAIIPNESRLGVFVWKGMIDYLRGISNHVSIGRAARNGKIMDAWFALVRQDPG